MQTYDDDDDEDDMTMFEPNPWGSRQRVAPRKTFKAAVSRIITLVPSLVRQLPPPIPARRLPSKAPALAPPAPAFGTPAFGAPTAPALPARIPSIAALAFAARMRPDPERTLPVKRVHASQLRKLVSALAGAVVALTIVLIVRTVHHTPPARASVGASLARSLATTEEPRRERRVRMPVDVPPATTVTITPIESPTVPTVAEVSQPAKPIAKKPRLKKPRRIVVGDTSTPLGDLRPSRFH